MVMNTDLEQRITFNLRQCGGLPCIRGLRIRVADVLEMLAQGVEPGPPHSECIFLDRIAAWK